MDLNEIFAPEPWLSETGGLRYIQLNRHIQRAIESQQLPPGTPLPPERELAKMTGLSRVTIRKAVAPLVAAGLIEQKQGSGTVVAAPITRVEQSLSRLSSFTEDMARRGMEVASVFLSGGIFLPSPQEIMTLGLSANASVARLERLRFANGTPMAIERASLPTDILANPLEVEHSLYGYLKKTGKQPARAVQHIIAMNLQKHDAALLEVDEGIAALQISRVSYLPSGKIAEFTRSLYRGDAYDFVAELKIGETG